MTTFPTWHRPYMLLFEVSQDLFGWKYFAVCQCANPTFQQRIFDLMVETIDKDLDFSTLGEMENWKKEARECKSPFCNFVGWPYASDIWN